MSTLPIFVARRATKALPLLQQQTRTAAYWNRDWRPADNLPKTEEEKRAIAKKYGLIPEDYKTYPDDGTGYGDYPNLPLVSAEQRDPHALYDMPELKRNYGEPLPIHFDMVGEDRWNYGQRLRWPLSTMLLTYVGVMSAFALLYFIGQEVRLYPVKMMPKPKLYDGKKYYSFDFKE